MRYNPPPNWPPPPHPGWQPPAGWRPDARWGPPPPGWRLWLDDARVASPPAPGPDPSALPAPEPRGENKVLAALKHPVWMGVATLVSVLAILAAIVLPGGSGESGSSSAVEIAAVSFGDLTPIKAVDTCGAACGLLGQTPPLPDTSTTPVDITLKNPTGQPLKIVKIDAEVLANRKVGCIKAGGTTVISAFYMIKIPATMALEQEPSTISTPTDFTVEPGSTGRMVVTVGPEKLYLDPDAALVRLKLVPESGDPLVTEPLAMIPPSAVENQSRTLASRASSGPDRDPCLQETAATLDGLAKQSSLQNSGFIDFRTLYDDAR